MLSNLQGSIKNKSSQYATEKQDRWGKASITRYQELLWSYSLRHCGTRALTDRLTDEIEYTALKQMLEAYGNVRDDKSGRSGHGTHEVIHLNMDKYGKIWLSIWGKKWVSIPNSLQT